jgi:ribose 5-phosphate isomerase B
MRIVVGADHRGFELKDAIAEYLRARGHEVIDVGTNDHDSVDYPDLAVAVGSAVTGGQADRGVLVCGSGVGACIAANKLPGIRAGLTHDTYSAHQGVEHDDMNVICIGSRVIGEEVAMEVVEAFVSAQFDPQERYVRRLNKVLAIEQETQKSSGSVGQKILG